ncbi:MAG: hypothetical protein HYZ73_07905 [Elusimicrobia bacterium]|nr:hypothetical protein [Elusimicrobiota bacterium]
MSTPDLWLTPGILSLVGQPYALTSLITCVLAALLGTFILWKNPKSPPARWWAIMCLFVATWAFWNTISLLSQTPEASLKYLRIADTFALFIPVTFLRFAMHFAGLTRPKFLKAGYLATAILALTAPTPWFVQSGQKKFGIWFEVGGPAFLAFAILFVVLPTYGLYLLYQAARKSEGLRRAQLISLILASSIGFGGGFMWFPPAFGVDIPPLGGHLVALYCVIVMYAIVRYRFLDIQLVIRRSLIYSILVTLLTVGYFGAIYLIEQFFQSHLGYRSTTISIAAFALMAFLFQPLKIAIQRLVDWLIFRAPHEELVKRMERLEQEASQAEKLRAVATLAAGMAHEIKNPLAALQTFAEFVPERHRDPAFAAKLHEILTTETRRIQEIVKDVLDFAKPKPPQLKPMEMAPLINSTLNLLSADLTKRRIRWNVECQDNLPANGSVAGGAIQADADQIRQVLINLIQNAADAIPDGGALRVATQTHDGYLELTVSDNGQGIPKELLPKIFDPFVTTKEHGNGLGLAMVHSIIQAHHGTIHVDSQPGRGTTFTVRLPL